MEEIRYMSTEKLEKKLKELLLTDTEIETIFSFLDLYEWGIIDNGDIYNIYDCQCGTIREEQDFDFGVLMETLYNRMHDYYLYEHEIDFAVGNEDLEYVNFYVALFKELISIGSKLKLVDNADIEEIKDNIKELEDSIKK